MVLYFGCSKYFLEDMLKLRLMALAWSLRNDLQFTSPLLFLGFAHLVITSGVNNQRMYLIYTEVSAAPQCYNVLYQCLLKVHVGEYGVCWNFFFTLAAVSILTSIVNISPSYCRILGSLILIGYQVCLMHGLNVYPAV